MVANKRVCFAGAFEGMSWVVERMIDVWFAGSPGVVCEHNNEINRLIAAKDERSVHMRARI